MTDNNTQAGAGQQASGATTKSHCPAGAGLINQGEATQTAHTPPQACATPAIDRAIATTSKAPHAQLAEGYKHPQSATTGHNTTEKIAMIAIHQNDYDAIGNQHEQTTSRINDMLIELQNHAYQTGVERGKQIAAEAAAPITSGEVPPTLCTTVHLSANQATIETGSMLNPAGKEVATLTIANGGTEVRLSFSTSPHASLVLHALIAPKEYRLVPAEGLRRVHRDLDACQKVIWLAGCQPRVPNGFDPAYVTEAQARLAEIDQWVEAQQP